MPKITTNDIRAEVNARVLADLQAALDEGRPMRFQQPWVGNNRARNLQSGKPYRGINALLLSFSSYSDPRWTTYNAAAKMDGKVRKGEKSTLVTLWKRIQVKDPDAPNGKKVIPILRYFRVFNVEQIDWPEGAIPALPTPEYPGDPIAEGEAALDDYLASDEKLTLEYGGNSAHYVPAMHHIQLPDYEDFTSPEGFYSVAFHECVHSTGNELGRELSQMKRKYSREELVAEIGSAFVLASLGIKVNIKNSAAYIKGWMKAIEDDENLMIKAAGQAQKAADRVLCVDPVEYVTEPAKEAVPA